MHPPLTPYFPPKLINGTDKVGMNGTEIVWEKLKKFGDLNSMISALPVSKSQRNVHKVGVDEAILAFTQEYWEIRYGKSLACCHDSRRMLAHNIQYNPHNSVYSLLKFLRPLSRSKLHYHALKLRSVIRLLDTICHGI